MNLKMNRAGAALLGACLLCCTAAFPAAAEEESSEADLQTYTSGDYTYSILVSDDEDADRAACIESYSGREEELEIPAELDGLEVIKLGDRAFLNAHQLKKVTLPETIIMLGDYAFAGCTEIAEYAVAVNNPVFTSVSGALYASNGTALARYPLGTKPTEVTVPEGVTMIGNVAFTDSQTLTSVKLPDSLEFIGNSAFAECDGLTEITIPPSVTIIDAFAFNSCKNLASVTLPEGLSEIGDAAFAATALESVKLPTTLTIVGQQAFAGTPMKEVTIPPSVTDIGYSSFGWDVSQSGEMLINHDFVIYGVSGSQAEYYCSDEENGSGFKFVPISAEEIAAAAEESSEAPAKAETSAPAADETEDSGEKAGVSGAVRVIGISVCGVLILAIILVAVLTGKGKKEKKPEASEKTEKKARTDKEDSGDAQ